MKKHGTTIGIVGSIIVAGLIAWANREIIFPLLLLATSLLFIKIVRRNRVSKILGLTLYWPYAVRYQPRPRLGRYSCVQRFKGTERVPIKNLFDCLRKGYTIKAFLEDFPSASVAQVSQLLEEVEKELKLSAA